MPAVVDSVHLSATHTFSKTSQESIMLIEGIGVEGDAHSGETVKHRSRVEKDPSQKNMRQVHLIHSELFEELAGKGFDVQAGALGENITTSGIDLSKLAGGTQLEFPSGATVELTGLRNPCSQIDGLAEGLMEATLDKDSNGNVIRKTGVMSVIVIGGEVKPGDSISVVRYGALGLLQPV
ncbi:MAG: MOSC domain-containing protein [Dehalococcoidia bacterium]